jgi:hypothetical protein
MNPRVRKVFPESGYRLRLIFTNNEERVYNVKPLLKYGVFRELRDESIFRSVGIFMGSVQWTGGQDLCPDTLYEGSKPLSRSKLAGVRERTANYRTKRSKSSVKSARNRKRA